MIKRISHNSRNTEVDAFASRGIDLYSKSGITDAPLVQMFDKVKQLQVRMTAAVNRMMVESGLEELDGDLDNDTRSLFHLVYGYTYHPDPKVSSAATEVKNVLDRYGLSMVYESYATQTSLTLSLIADLEKPELAKPLSKLSGCGVVVNNIKESHIRFNDGFLSYQKQKSTEGEEANATELRKQLRELINSQIINYLNAMADYSPEYTQFVNTFAQMVEESNDVVRKRRAKAKEGISE